MIQLTPLKLRIIMVFFFDLSEGIENCKMSGKSQGILKWTIGGNPDTCSIDVEMFLWFSYQWFASLLAANFKQEKYLNIKGRLFKALLA